MIQTTRQLQPLDVFREDLTTAVAVAATELAVILFDDLARGPRSGPVWSEFGSEHPASVPGEPEQEQSGDLRASVGVREASAPGLAFAQAVGFFDEDMEKLERLEIDQDSPTYRGWLTVIVLDPDAQAAATTAAVDAVRR